MSRTSLLSTRGIVVRHLRSSGLATVLIAVLVAVGVFAVALVPRALAILSQEELRAAVAALTPDRADLRVTGDLGAQGRDPAETDEIFAAMQDDLEVFGRSLEEPLGSITGEPEWIALTDAAVAGYAGEAPVPAQPSIRLATDARWTERVRIVEGALPLPWEAVDDLDSESVDAGEAAPVELVLSTDAAARLGLRVGDVLTTDLYSVGIAGLFEPVDAADPYWIHAPEPLEPTVRPVPGGLDGVTATGYVAPGTVVTQSAEFDRASLRVWYPTDATPLVYADVEPLIAQAARLETTGTGLWNGQQLLVLSGLPRALELVQDRLAATSALLALIISAPLGAVFATLLLGVRTAVERRRGALGLLGARGATIGQRRGILFIEGLLIALPAAAVAIIAAAVLAPAELGIVDHLGPLAVALAVPVLFAALTPDSGMRQTRADVSPRARSTWRWVAEAAVVGLAVTALVLLSNRGLEGSTSVGIDPLLAATPVLLCLAVTVLLLRVYPLVLLGLQRRVPRQRSVVPLLGAARAVRDPSVGFTSVLAITIGVAAAVFAVVVQATIGAGLTAAARSEVGADIRVTTPALDDGLLAEFAATDGVRTMAPVDLHPGAQFAFGNDFVGVTVVVADLDALRSVGVAIPESAAPASPIPFFASSDVADRMGGTASTIDDIDVERVGILPRSTFPTVELGWVLIDDESAGRLLDDDDVATAFVLVAVDDPATTAGLADALRSIAPETAAITDAESTRAAAASRPTTAALGIALTAAGVLSVVLGLLAIAVGSLAVSVSRNRMIGVLRMLGMSPRQLRGLLAWELTPAALAAVVVGAALGLALPFLVTTLIDLRDFVGGDLPVTPDIPAVLVAVTTSGFFAAVLVIGAIALAIGRRVDPASTIRIGAE